MGTNNRFAKLFFASSAAVLLVAASRLPASARAQDAFVGAEESDVAAPYDQQSDIDALLKRCPGRVMPVCGTATSGGITLNYYFP